MAGKLSHLWVRQRARGLNRAYSQGNRTRGYGEVQRAGHSNNGARSRIYGFACLGYGSGVWGLDMVIGRVVGKIRIPCVKFAIWVKNGKSQDGQCVRVGIMARGCTKAFIPGMKVTGYSLRKNGQVVKANTYGIGLGKCGLWLGLARIL